MILLIHYPSRDTEGPGERQGQRDFCRGVDKNLGTLRQRGEEEDLGGGDCKVLLILTEHLHFEN